MAVSAVAVPLTGFSGTGGLVVGEIGGGGVTGRVPRLRTPHQLFSALSRLPLLANSPAFGLPVTVVVPSAARLSTP